MKTISILTLLCGFYSVLLKGQVLSGILMDQNKHLPIVGAEVFIQGAGRDITTSSGQFSIGIQNCKACGPGNTVSINAQHKDYGFQSIDRIVKSNYQVSDVYLTVVNSVQVTGRIRNKINNNSVAGIKVTCQIPAPNFTPPIVTTDIFGRFEFIFNRQQVGSINFINILCHDPTGCYADKIEQKPINQVLDIDIPLDKQAANTWCMPVNKSDLERRTLNIIRCSVKYGSNIQSATVEDGNFTNGNTVSFQGTFKATLIIDYGGPFRGEYDVTTGRIKSLTVHNTIQGDRQMAQQFLDCQ